MSKLEGGIFSRPRGKTGGIVFGAARTRRGKQVTTRLLVPPSNPNTAAQQAQRSKFKLTLQLIRSIGPDFYQQPFNRVVSQLPGFQSLMSILMNNFNDTFGWGPTGKETYLRGSNPLPDGITVTLGTGEVDLTWSATPKTGGLAGDEVFAIAYPRSTPDDALEGVQTFDGQTIGDGATGYTIDNPDDEDVVIFLWTVGSGANAGIYSNIVAGDNIGS